MKRGGGPERSGASSWAREEADSSCSSSPSTSATPYEKRSPTSRSCPCKSTPPAPTSSTPEEPHEPNATMGRRKDPRQHRHQAGVRFGGRRHRQGRRAVGEW